MSKAPRFTLENLRPGLQEQVVASLHPVKSTAGRKNALPQPATSPAQVRPLSRTSGKGAYPLTLWLDYRVPSLNRILGKRWAPVKEKGVAKAALALTLYQLPASCWPTQREHTKLQVLVTLYRCQLIDPDNCFVKPLIDQMRYAGLLRNDDPDSIVLTIQQVRVSKLKLQGTKVTLAECLP